MRRRTSKQRRCSSPGPTSPPREAEAPGKLTQKRVARLDRNWRGQLHHSTELLITEADCVSIHVKEIGGASAAGAAARRENTGGEHRPDFKAHRRGHAAKGFQPWAVARLSVTRLDEIKSPAAVRGFFVALVSSPDPVFTADGWPEAGQHSCGIMQQIAPAVLSIVEVEPRRALYDLLPTT